MMKEFTAIMLVLLTACCVWTACELLEMRKRTLTLAIQFDGLRDQQEHYNERNRKAIEQLKRFEPGTFDPGVIEYSHPIYKIPGGNK
jgi:predicted ATP-grasp superfamily ATP-dependent carboligase